MASAARTDRYVHARLVPCDPAGTWKIPGLEDGFHLLRKLECFRRRKRSTRTDATFTLISREGGIHLFKLRCQLSKDISILRLKSKLLRFAIEISDTATM